MGTTVTSNDLVGGGAETTRDLVGVNVRRGGRGGGGGGGGGNGKGPGGGGGGDRDGWTPGRYRIGVFVGIASILMMFSALASAYVVRAGLPGSMWRQTPVPTFLWVSTALIVLSSVTIVAALRAQRRGHSESFRRWLGLTLVLGVGFLASQLLAWRQLVAGGFYLASNPHSSFFYVLTGLHGVHLLGGVAGLGYLLARALRAKAAAGGAPRPRGEAKLRTLADVVAIYWHFMDGLWVFIFLLLFLWR